MEEKNPYLAPTATAELAPPSFDDPVKLHSLVSVVMATFFGSPVGGGLLMAMNYWRTKQTGYAWCTLFGAFLITLLMCIIAYFLPDDLPSLVFVAPQLVLVYFIAKALQGEMIEQHLACGGQFSSRWAAVGWGLLCGLLFIIAIVAILLLLPEEMIFSAL